MKPFGCDCPECQPDRHRKLPDAPSSHKAEAPADVSGLTMESAKDPAADRVGKIIGLVVVLSLAGLVLTALLALGLWALVVLGIPGDVVSSGVTLVLAATFVAFLVTAPRRKR